jgi:predicted ATP-binding protein involved in virulence
MQEIYLGSSMSLGILGIIREIEVRRLEMLAREFDGVILIDELDLHLHPTWQRLIVRALKDAFPRTQFIVTTHSPHMIQNAERGEVIALINDDEGNPRVANFELSEFGFKGWTIEEILQDVMELWDVASDEYRVAMEKFDFALSRNDAKEIKIWLDKLEAMLHPRNHLRKILRLQAAPFEEGGND